ncbi:MAG: ATP-binding protein [Rickettsiales bacterium]|jgi:predicted AAA+ superfamily ATPase|nr:ATP-binding protein [Rickettsiales bacterium]
MKRFALDDLIIWKNSKNHKPLIIQGARQVGKTWLMKEFGRTQYENVAYIWFEGNPLMKELFSKDMDVRRILSGLELETGEKIEPHKTLIIFDEIQNCPNALTSLKYFNENAPEYDIVAAGSLLGVALHSGTSFPVGKVDFMDLRPMCFGEFLLALGQNKLFELLQSRDWDLIKVFKDRFIEALKQYFYVGGMPDVIKAFADGNKDYSLARQVQIRILNSYQNDFSKHIPTAHLERVRGLWNSIPMQLAKENKKFVYSEVQKGTSASTYELSLGWLENCGLIHKISRVSKPAQPLKGYENTGAFKLFLCDIGLLSAMSMLNERIILDDNKMFTEFKGALTEQFACQEMQFLPDSHLSYWTNNNATAEIDFVLGLGSSIIPVEVKAATNLKAKSLIIYRDKFEPEIMIRTSLADYRQAGNLYDIPLYALAMTKEIVEG